MLRFLHAVNLNRKARSACERFPQVEAFTLHRRIVVAVQGLLALTLALSAAYLDGCGIG